MSRTPADYGRVAVLMGGTSGERAISLQTGAAALAALQAAGVDAAGLEVGHDPVAPLRPGGYTRVFIALHGRGGEDGTVQGALELMGLPYTGSGVLGSALAMDKLRSKQLWQGAGLPTPGHRVVDAHTDWTALAHALGLPLMLKPTLEGSSLGIAKVARVEELPAAHAAAAAFHCPVLAEQYIAGAEYTVGLAGDAVLPAIRLETPRAFYDYAAKYTADDTRYHCPCGLARSEEEDLQRLAFAAFEALDCAGWGRVDLMRDRAGKAWLIEANTVPGLTGHSLVPMAALAAGWSFEQLVLTILDTSFHDSPGPRRLLAAQVRGG